MLSEASKRSEVKKPDSKEKIGSLLMVDEKKEQKDQEKQNIDNKIKNYQQSDHYLKITSELSKKCREIVQAINNKNDYLLVIDRLDALKKENEIANYFNNDFDEEKILNNNQKLSDFLYKSKEISAVVALLGEKYKKERQEIEDGINKLDQEINQLRKNPPKLSISEKFNHLIGQNNRLSYHEFQIDEKYREKSRKSISLENKIKELEKLQYWQEKQNKASENLMNSFIEQTKKEMSRQICQNDEIDYRTKKMIDIKISQIILDNLVDKYDVNIKDQHLLNIQRKLEKEKKSDKQDLDNSQRNFETENKSFETKKQFIEKFAAEEDSVNFFIDQKAKHSNIKLIDSLSPNKKININNLSAYQFIDQNNPDFQRRIDKIVNSKDELKSFINASQNISNIDLELTKNLLEKINHSINKNEQKLDNYYVTDYASDAKTFKKTNLFSNLIFKTDQKRQLFANRIEKDLARLNLEKENIVNLLKQHEEKTKFRKEMTEAVIIENNKKIIRETKANFSFSIEGNPYDKLLKNEEIFEKYVKQKISDIIIENTLLDDKKANNQTINEIINDSINKSENEESIIERQPWMKNLNETKSKELQKIKQMIFPLLLKSPFPEKQLSQIEAIFERNNLPEFAKKFKIFEIIYLKPNNQKDFANLFDQEMNESQAVNVLGGTQKVKLSPILNRINRLKKGKLKNAILADTFYKDLLKINIRSNNSSLKNNFILLQKGQNLFDKLDKNGPDSLNSDELTEISAIFEKLDVLYENSLLYQRQSEHFSQTIDKKDIQKRFYAFKQDLKVKNGQTIKERIFEMFVQPLGYKSFEEAIDGMDQINKVTHQRNVEQLGDKNIFRDGKFIFNNDYLIKGMGDSTFDYFMQEGSVAREFIGLQSSSDMTPFDSDFFSISKKFIQSKIDKLFAGAKKYASNSIDGKKDKNGVVVIIRDRQQFVRTDNFGDNKNSLNKEIDKARKSSLESDKYELFRTGYWGKEHFGVRTGMPPTEVDVVMCKKEVVQDEIRLEKVFHSIANNGYYIPVIDEEGKIIFTPDDFAKFQLNSQLIKASLSDTNFQSDNLLSNLKKSPFIKKLFSFSSGVKEGYSVGQHTQMVMNQFEKYFGKNHQNKILSKEEFRLVLSLHDLGKGLANLERGSTAQQHEYTKKVLWNTLKSLNLEADKMDLIINLIDQDILGEFIKESTNNIKLKTDSIDYNRYGQEINKLAKALGKDPKDTLLILKQIYFCDAGSYTKDAGGQASLDEIFDFEKTSETSQATFSNDYEDKFAKLANQLSQNKK